MAQLPTIAVGGFVDKLLGKGWKAGGQGAGRDLIK